MPTLRSLTDVARYDGRFFVDAVVPALSSAGFTERMALLLSEPAFAFGEVDDAAVVIEGTDDDVNNLFAGKRTSSLRVRGHASSLRALLLALRPQADTRKQGTRELGTEASAPALRKKRDRVRTADGRYIKGTREGATTTTKSAAPAAASTLLAPPKTAPTDRTSFALQNFAAWLDAGLRRVDASDDDFIVVEAGEASRG